MKIITKFLATAAIAAVSIANAAETPVEATDEAFAARETFGKWRISVGGAFNSQVGADLHGRNLPVPTGYVVPAGRSTWASAKAKAEARKYDGNGYLGESGDGWGTRNWELPQSAYQGDGKFVLRNAYEEVTSSHVGGAWADKSDDCCEYGFSFEVSRELWIHDEQDEHRWGVDLAFAVSYFFSRNIYNARGMTYRSDTVRSGEFQTYVNDPDAMYLYDSGYSYDTPTASGMYGHGAAFTDFSPMILWDNVGSPTDAGRSGTVNRYNGFVASGDYQELEMLLMLRPWYEITDWWRVYAEIGVGVSWGYFESDINGSGLAYSEDFSKWDCYGVAGIGTMLRYGMFDISLDLFGRFLRDDMDIDGRYVNGSIDRSDWCLRVMVGVEF